MKSFCCCTKIILMRAIIHCKCQLSIEGDIKNMCKSCPKRATEMKISLITLLQCLLQLLSESSAWLSYDIIGNVDKDDWMDSHVEKVQMARSSWSFLKINKTRYPILNRVLLLPHGSRVTSQVN